MTHIWLQKLSGTLNTIMPNTESHLLTSLSLQADFSCNNSNFGKWWTRATLCLVQSSKTLSSNFWVSWHEYVIQAVFHYVHQLIDNFACQLCCATSLVCNGIHSWNSTSGNDNESCETEQKQRSLRWWRQNNESITSGAVLLLLMSPFKAEPDPPVQNEVPCHFFLTSSCVIPSCLFLWCPPCWEKKKKMAGYYQLFLCAKQGFSDKLLEKKNINLSQIEKYVNGAWFPVESLPPPAPLEGFEGWKWDTVTNFLLWPCSAEMLNPLICLFFEFSQKTLQDLCRRKRWDFTLGISSGMQRHTRNRISQGWQQPGLFS